jgi:hypothetical protein
MLGDCGRGGEGARTNDASKVTICMDVSEVLDDMDEEYEGYIMEIMNKYIRLGDPVWKRKSECSENKKYDVRRSFDDARCTRIMFRSG